MMRKSLDLFVLIGSLLLTFGAWKISQQSVAMQKERQLQAKTEAVALYFNQQMKQYYDSLLGAHGLFAASKSVEQKEFLNYFEGQNISVNFPGVYSFSYISRVLDAETPSFLKQLKIEHEIDSPEMSTVLQPGEDHYIVNYILYNRDIVSSFYGFDLKSDTTRRAALEKARDTGELTTIGPVIIKGPEQLGFIMSTPIYMNGMPVDTVEERRAALQGFVNETFLYEDFFGHIFSSINHDGLTIRIKDNNQLIYDSADKTESEKASKNAESEAKILLTVPVGSAKWQFEFTPDPQSAQIFVEEYFPNVVLMIGTLMSILLFGIVFALSSSQVRANDMAEKMTQELRNKNEFIEQVLDHLPIGIAVNSITTGKAVYMNPAFESVYGWGRNKLSSIQAFFNSVYPDPLYRAKMKQAVSEALASQDPAKMHWDNIRITTETGLERFVSARNIPLAQQDLMVSTVIDTTDRSLTEKEINNKKEELEQMNKLMIGRELKMVELKEEVERLRKEALGLRKQS